MSEKTQVRVGTRGSELALVQAKLVAAALGAAFPDKHFDLVPFTTRGDRLSGASKQVSDKKDWILEIEEALLRDEIDFAVHSSKDVPISVAQETVLLPVLARENPLDAYFSKHPGADEDPGRLLPGFAPGSKVATASARRRAQLLRLRPDLVVTAIHGNVPTRLQKFQADASVSGLVLAAAGLQRLGLLTRASGLLRPDEMLPAVNQGILAVQASRARTEVVEMLEALVVPETRSCWTAERAFIALLEADCDSAVGVLGQVQGRELVLSARVLSPDGRICLEDSLRGGTAAARELGEQLGEKLLARGAAELL